MIVQSRVASCSAAFLLFIGYTGRKIPARTQSFWQAGAQQCLRPYTDSEVDN
jgi:hypothetical protein